jgi:hypothetical protein
LVTNVLEVALTIESAVAMMQGNPADVEVVLLSSVTPQHTLVISRGAVI